MFFNFNTESKVFQTHLPSQAFIQNLMSSWGFGVWFWIQTYWRATGNLMSSRGFRIWFWKSQFFPGITKQNHAKSMVFHTYKKQLFFLSKIWCQVGELERDSHWWPQAFLILRVDHSLVLHLLWLVLHLIYQSHSRPSPYISLLGPAQHLHDKREARIYGWGLLDGISVVSFNFLCTFWGL